MGQGVRSSFVYAPPAIVYSMVLSIKTKYLFNYFFFWSCNYGLLKGKDPILFIFLFIDPGKGLGV